ncbi:SDR family oxidoreductase [Tautonia rosea]|uniref:SDR family oxidoreductase n=1 Tax=Tautonia rosea TaxID=2728037 RepID=UPI00147397DE|nr:SDR family oxidoreductase [Tautonia rosea]
MASKNLLNEPTPPFEPQTQNPPGLDAEMTPRPRHSAEAYKAAGKLTDQVALITGGDSGIGAAVAILFAREGADVAIVYLPEEQRDAEHVRQHVEKIGRRCLCIPGDLKDSSFCNQAVEQTVRKLGKLDILVNNAAYMPKRTNFDDITDDDLDKVFRTNVYSFFYMTRAAVKHLKPGAAIINTGSVAGMEGSKAILDYSASKAAVHAFTKALAQMLVDRQIRVNCVAPGPVWTPLNASARDADEMAEYGGNVPMGRPGQPEEMAPAFVYFASNPDSSYVTGEVLSLYGGVTQAG